MNSAALWDLYQRQGDPLARETLLSQNLRLVHHVARQLTRRLRADVEFDDLVSAGTIGLVRAIENFDPSRGLAFSTFAAPRIRGAILDDLRRWDHVPRSVRRKQRQLSAAREALRGSLARQPQAEETAKKLGIGIETLWTWEWIAQDTIQVSIDRFLESEADGNPRTPLDFLVGESGEEIEEEVNHEQEVAILKKEIGRLKERERIVLSLYYFEDLKLHEIATILELTESRISQIRSKAVATLRERLKSLRD